MLGRRSSTDGKLMILDTGNDDDRSRKRVRAEHRAGNVTAELFPTGMRAVIAKDPSKESIAEAAVPVLRSAHLARELGRAALARVNAVFLKEHFASRLRRALSPQLPVCEAVAKEIPRAGLRKKNASVSADVVSKKSHHSPVGPP